MTTQRLDPNKLSENIGAIPTRGGFVTPDVPFNVPTNPDTPNLVTTGGEYSACIYVGVGGDILLRSEDGSIQPYLSVPSGRYIWAKANMVVSEATLDGVLRSTSASSLTWHGGQ